MNIDVNKFAEQLKAQRNSLADAAALAGAAVEQLQAEVAEHKRTIEALTIALDEATKNNSKVTVVK